MRLMGRRNERAKITHTVHMSASAAAMLSSSAVSSGPMLTRSSSGEAITTTAKMSPCASVIGAEPQSIVLPPMLPEEKPFCPRKAWAVSASSIAGSLSPRRMFGASF